MNEKEKFQPSNHHQSPGSALKCSLATTFEHLPIAIDLLATYPSTIVLIHGVHCREFIK